jgi:hypothetical protein
MGYADLGLSPGMVGVHHAVLHRALKQVARYRLITTNAAADVEHRLCVRKSVRIGSGEGALLDRRRGAGGAHDGQAGHAAGGGVYLPGARRRRPEIRTATKQLTTG